MLFETDQFATLMASVRKGEEGKEQMA